MKTKTLFFIVTAIVGFLCGAWIGEAMRINECTEILKKANNQVSKHTMIPTTNNNINMIINRRNMRRIGSSLSKLSS